MEREAADASMATNEKGARVAHANTEELIEAWNAMDDRELLRLRKIAGRLIGGTRFAEPLELAHEAFERCLDGRRNWPTHVAFSVYLGNVMRSVACAERKSERRKPPIASMDDWASEADFDGGAPSPERILMDRAEAAAWSRRSESVGRLLGEDAEARKVWSAMRAGLTPKQIRARLGMGAKAFEAARMRVARRAGRAAHH